MNSDEQLLASTKKLKDIALRHVQYGKDEECTEEAMKILRSIQIYAHSLISSRPVVIDQIENNVSDIRRWFYGNHREEEFAGLSNNVDNLIRYCGAKI